MKRTQPWVVIGLILIAVVNLQAQLVEAIDITNMIYVPDEGQYGPWEMDPSGNYILGNKMQSEWSLASAVRHETVNFSLGDNYWAGSFGSTDWQGSGGQIDQVFDIATNGSIVGSFTWDYFVYDADGDTIPDTLFNATVASIADANTWGTWKALGILDDSLAYGSTNFSSAKLVSADGNVIIGDMAVFDNSQGWDTNLNIPFVYHLDSDRLDTELPGLDGSTTITALSGDGSILVGYSTRADYSSEGYIWTLNAEGGYDTTHVAPPVVSMNTARISANGQHISGGGELTFSGQTGFMMTQINGIDTTIQMTGFPGVPGSPMVTSIANDGTAFGAFQEAGGPWGGPVHPWMWNAAGGAKDVAYALEALGMEIPTGSQGPFDQGQVLAADTTGKKLFINWTNANWEAAYSWVILPDVAPPAHLEIAYSGDNHVVPATLELEWQNVLPYDYTYRVEYAYMPYGGTWGAWTELANNYDDDAYDHDITEGGYYKYRVVSLYGADESMATESMPYEIRRLMDEPAIIAVMDVPEDQGGKVIVNFAASGFDILGGMTNELYTVETYIADQWVAVGNTAAYGSNEYSVLINTINDSVDEGTTNSQDYRVVAALGEDAFFSATASGYSTDDIAPPVPTGLAGEILDGTGIALTWDPVNINDLGLYEVYRGTDANLTDGVRIGQSASNNFTDSDVDFENGATYYYAVAGLDIHENLGETSSSYVMTVLNVDLQGVPDAFALSQNYPNPFNPSTSINFSLPEAAEMTLIVYDVSGREVARLVDASMSAGYHQVIWNGMNAEGQAVSTGMYIYRMQADTYTETRKMTYLR